MLQKVETREGLRESSPTRTEETGRSFQVIKMETLQELFAAADKIGAKYQSESERTDFQKQMDAINADIIREAVKRGEYDQEKKIWLV